MENQNQNQNQIQVWQVWFGSSFSNQQLWNQAEISTLKVDRITENSVWANGKREPRKTKERIICETFEEAQKRAMWTLNAGKRRLLQALASVQERRDATELLTAESVIESEEKAERKQQERLERERLEWQAECLIWSIDEILSVWIPKAA